MTPDPKATIQTTYRVEAHQTAAAMAERPDEKFPAVLATPFLIGAMERTSAQLMEPLLVAGQMTVGAVIDVQHRAPTAVGANYRCTAVFVEKVGLLYWFDVTAEDGAGLIGKGRIARAIVDEQAIMARAASSLATNL